MRQLALVGPAAGPSGGKGSSRRQVRQVARAPHGTVVSPIANLESTPRWQFDFQVSPLPPPPLNGLQGFDGQWPRNLGKVSTWLRR
jgi:hypothetical protein